MSKKLVLKLILLGDPGVGKTSLISQYVRSVFQHSYKLTIGLDISSKEVILEDDRRALLSINDIGGQERFASIRQMFFRGAHLAMFVYDLTRPESLQNIKNVWYDELSKFKDPKQSIHEPPVSILVGNKADLEDLIMIEEEEADKVAKEIGVEQHIITSAKSNQNVNEAFTMLANVFINKRKN